MKAHKILFSVMLALAVQIVNAQCFIGGFGSLGQLYKSTGNTALDSKFNSSKVDLESAFNVRVNLFVYDDGNAPNAYATRGGSYSFDGMVAFGFNMLTQRLWRMERGEYAVAGVLAHEFAHVLQIKKGCPLTGKDRELQADFLAGYYFGKRHMLSSGIRNFAGDLFELGDYNFWHPQHHGTPDERVAAVMAGFQKGSLSVTDAYNEGIEYLGHGGGDDDDDDDDEEEEEDCYECDGTGELEITKRCGYCRGSGFRACGVCRGAGGVYANGYNTIGQYGYWFYICGNCGGAKGDSCDACDGSGEVTQVGTCKVCHGTGKN